MWSCYSSVSTKLSAYVLARSGSRGDHLTSLYTDTQREMKKLHQQAFCHLQLTIHWQRGRAVIVLLVFCVLYFAITRFMEFDHASQLASHVYCTRWPFNLRFYFVREKKNKCTIWERKCNHVPGVGTNIPLVIHQTAFQHFFSFSCHRSCPSCSSSFSSCIMRCNFRQHINSSSGGNVLFHHMEETYYSSQGGNITSLLLVSTFQPTAIWKMSMRRIHSLYIPCICLSSEIQDSSHFVDNHHYLSSLFIIIDVIILSLCFHHSVEWTCFFLVREY